MKFEKGNKIGNRFKPGESGNPSGKPRKFSLVIGDIPQDAQIEIYRRLHKAISMGSIEEASKYLRSEAAALGEYGVVLQVAIRALNGNNGWQALNDILDRLFGKARQATDLTISGAADERSVIEIRSRNEREGGDI